MLNECPKSRITEHAIGLSLVTKPEIASTSAMLITGYLASPSRRAVKARERGVPFILRETFSPRARAGLSMVSERV